jgi:hypothetical protein
MRLPRRRLRAEVDVHRGIWIDDETLLLAADAGKLLVGLQQLPRLRVIHVHRPEVLGRYVRRQMQPIGLSAVEVLACGVVLCHRILRADSHHLHRHRGAAAPGGVEVKRSRVEVKHAAG